MPARPPESHRSQVSVYAGGRCHLTAEIKGVIEVGRRRSGEPAPFHLQPGEPASRLIVASPIQGSSENCVGALSGIRIAPEDAAFPQEMTTRLEASLIELIASGVRCSG